MTAYWLAQGVGVIAFLIGITPLSTAMNAVSGYSWRSIALLSAFIFS